MITSDLSLDMKIPPIFIVLHGPNLNQVVVVPLLTVGTFTR